MAGTGCPRSECRRAKADRKPATLNGSSRPLLLDNWLDTGPGARASKGALTWTGEPVKRSGP